MSQYEIESLAAEAKLADEKLKSGKQGKSPTKRKAA